MVTNINLVSPETEKKTRLTGKTSLVISLSLLALVVVIFFGLVIAKNSYTNEKNDLTKSIQQEKNKVAGPAYAEISDFQEKLMLLNGIIGDHVYVESYLRSFSHYILPEVHLTDFSWSGSDQTLKISGLAPNFDSLSKEVILLKTYAGIDSLELDSAGESQTSGQSGVQFKISAKLNREAFNKTN